MLQRAIDGEGLSAIQLVSLALTRVVRDEVGISCPYSVNDFGEESSTSETVGHTKITRTAP